jgi:hypothetical protein
MRLPLVMKSGILFFEQGQTKLAKIAQNKPSSAAFRLFTQ